ncbi:Spo0E family sporulation regulatory protein-aspartic acid phosphatase [Rossellomorea vietnamensis]|uniref:Spo0E family sporulation regulatory protein-aspartic acid phosphatase n=1 Tax=Rossellomorea vietnamensis TaxID=218284 RepID=UPI00308A1D2B|nr:aspartyl-phosphate phosphatase Spo0E family protein [Rossellomorea vietnamensis]WQI94693.1 aspartyl-phosphate phosphatase Spo0E family protein [Rossellomorea vietnamensis]
MNVTEKNQHSLLHEMETKRLELKYLAQYHGFSHPETVRLSQELDDLFNTYHQLNQQ